MQKRLEATEMWFLRRMLRIPWTARRTNQAVMEMAGTTRKLITATSVVSGPCVERKQPREGLPLGWAWWMEREREVDRVIFMDGIKPLVGCRNVAEVIRLAENREEWRNIVANVSVDTAPR